ncbi:hypothetical protein HY256_00465, partial [Candidatus Sumerlaeota bacterium]|nr:hypothetical protein [Candidatus Sumerlaeota bacterium]
MKSQDDTGGDRRRLSKTELMIILVIIFILAGIAVPNFMEASLRSKVSKRDASMRNFATALESYYVDHKSYPPMRPLKDFVRDKSWLKKSGGENLSAASPWLTTPVSYLGAFPSDPFTSSREPAPFAYYSDGLNGWICFSPGPDLDYD